jgi:hypothetical protein
MSPPFFGADALETPWQQRAGKGAGGAGLASPVWLQPSPLGACGRPKRRRGSAIRARMGAVYGACNMLKFKEECGNN